MLISKLVILKNGYDRLKASCHVHCCLYQIYVFFSLKDAISDIQDVSNCQTALQIISPGRKVTNKNCQACKRLPPQVNSQVWWSCKLLRPPMFIPPLPESDQPFRCIPPVLGGKVAEWQRTTYYCSCYRISSHTQVLAAACVLQFSESILFSLILGISSGILHSILCIHGNHTTS